METTILDSIGVIIQVEVGFEVWPRVVGFGFRGFGLRVQQTVCDVGFMKACLCSYYKYYPSMTGRASIQVEDIQLSGF